MKMYITGEDTGRIFGLQLITAPFTGCVIGQLTTLPITGNVIRQ